MIILDHQSDPRSWAEEHFGGATFTDVRRVERAITIAAAMATNPGASIPRLFTRWYDTKAAYAFFRHWEVDAQMLQAGHLNRKRDGMPGWQTLWHGFTKLQLLCEGVRLAKTVDRFG
jgi:hypothetical protein